MSVGNTVRSGTQWLITKSISTQVSQFVFGIILARLLVPADFGLVTTIQIFTGLVGMVVGGGMAMSLVQARRLAPHDYDAIFTLQLAIGALIFAGFYVIAPAFATLFGNPSYVELLRVAAIDFLWRPFNNTLYASLQREMRFKAQAGMMFLGMALSGILSIALAWQGLGVWSLILSPVVAKIIMVPLLIVLARQPLHLSVDRSAISKLGGYGMRMSLNNFVIYANRQIDNLIISHQLGPASLGLYNKATSLHYTPIDVIGQSAYQTVFRALSAQQDEPVASRQLFFRTINLVSLYTLPFYVGLLWLAKPFIEVVYGRQWLPAATPLQILVLAGIFHCIVWPARAAIAARNRLGSELRIQLGYGLLLTAGCLISVRWGLIGVAWTVLALKGYQAILVYRLAEQSIDGRHGQLGTALKPALVLNALLFFVLWLVDILLELYNPTLHQGWYLLIMCITGGAAYGAAFLFLPLDGLASEAQHWKDTLFGWRRAG